MEFPAASRWMLTMRGRIGAAVRATDRIALRPELLVDVGAGLDILATARLGVAYRF
jgi:hypothetical protein